MENFLRQLFIFRMTLTKLNNDQLIFVYKINEQINKWNKLFI